MTGEIRIHCISRKDAEEMHEAVVDFLEVHAPDAYVGESRRIVKIRNIDAEDVVEGLIAADILDPTEHDYIVEK